jgi:hypothetical protein
MFCHRLFADPSLRALRVSPAGAHYLLPIRLEVSMSLRFNK